LLQRLLCLLRADPAERDRCARAELHVLTLAEHGLRVEELVEERNAPVAAHTAVRFEERLALGEILLTNVLSLHHGFQSSEDSAICFRRQGAHCGDADVAIRIRDGLL